ncbi:MAG: hypothetical protein F4020_09975 [Gammaproteobacteria bacterium]|nr:hypothetical protein [Gammaproteobacteria bacterium]MYK69809.1 hypothetical protein [Gammaproteobacteria bacterium]
MDSSGAGGRAGQAGGRRSIRLPISVAGTSVERRTGLRIFWPGSCGCFAARARFRRERVPADASPVGPGPDGAHSGPPQDPARTRVRPRGALRRTRSPRHAAGAGSRPCAGRPRARRGDATRTRSAARLPLPSPHPPLQPRPPAYHRTVGAGPRHRGRALRGDIPAPAGRLARSCVALPVAGSRAGHTPVRSYRHALVQAVGQARPPGSGSEPPRDPVPVRPDARHRHLRRPCRPLPARRGSGGRARTGRIAPARMAGREQRPALDLTAPGPRRRAGLVHSRTLARTRFQRARRAAGPPLAGHSHRDAGGVRPCASTPTRIPGRIVMTAMEAFRALGVIRWPLTFSLLVVVALALWSLALVWRNAMPGRHAKAWIDAILFWGGFAAISGVLGTLVGIIITFQFIELAGEVRATLVAGGIKVALLSSALGTLILAVASLLWFGLQLRWRFLIAEHTGGPA